MFLSLFLLVVLFPGNDGAPRIVVEGYPTKAACEAQIKSTSEYLLQLGVNKASVSCTEYKIGDLT